MALDLQMPLESTVDGGERPAAGLGEPLEALSQMLVVTLELGQQMQANQVPQRCRALIRGIRDGLQTGLLESQLDHASGDRQQGTQQPVAPLGDGCQTPKSGAGEQADGHGLGLVVGMVRGHHPVETELPPPPVELCVAESAGRFLLTLTAPAPFSGVDAGRVERQVQAVGQLAGGQRALVRLGIQTVVDVEQDGSTERAP